MEKITSEQPSRLADHLLLLGVIIALTVGVYFVVASDNKQDQPFHHQNIDTSQTQPIHGETVPRKKIRNDTIAVAADAFKTSSELYQLFANPVLNERDIERAHYLLDTLFQSGLSALPVVRELLNIREITAPTDEHRSLRMALINMLWYLDDPVVKGIALDGLHNTIHPAEIYELASLVREWSPPGLHQWEILRVANSALQQGMEQSAGESLGPLFQVLGEFGDDATLTQLQAMPKHMEQYAAVALAMLPDGKGIPALVDDAKTGGANTLQGRLAIKLLGQMTLEQPSAADALVGLVSDNAIPLALWPELKELISGSRRIQVTVQTGQRASRNIIYLPTGNQVIYEVRTPPLSDAFDACSALLNRLLSVTQDKNAQRAMTAMCDRL